MSAMGQLYLEMSEDFENLTETSMKFKGSDWESQEGRFDGEVDYSFGYIYWFENYASLMLGRRILQDLGEEYKVLFDSGFQQWVIITDLQSPVWC